MHLDSPWQFRLIQAEQTRALSLRQFRLIPEEQGDMSDDRQFLTCDKMFLICVITDRNMVDHMMNP